MIPIFNDIQKKKADFIITNKHAKLSSLTSSEIKDLAVVWCYYSGKIEGNTYTYVETEALLKDNITSEKRYEDAKMLKTSIILLFPKWNISIRSIIWSK